MYKANLFRKHRSDRKNPGFLFHSCDLRRKRSETFYFEEDSEAINFLQEREISFELVDLSKCPFKMKLKAKIAGVKRTPALVLDNGTVLNGLQKIKEYFSK